MELERLPRSEWNRATAAHLAARAGFGGTPAELDALEAMGLERAVEWYLDFPAAPSEEPPDWVGEVDVEPRERLAAMRGLDEEGRRKLLRERLRESRIQILDLTEWWMRRMMGGNWPLQEKLTLFWHGHFATSFQKVRQPALMWKQNETFRRLAGGRWREMVEAMVSDPAMLIWLDGGQSRRSHPNENFARELMELFTLGEGRYAEEDVREAARALTGYQINRRSGKVVFNDGEHDDGVKTIFGRSGRWGAREVVGLILERAEADRFVTRKLWSYFTGLERVPEGWGEVLAGRFRACGGHVGDWLGEVFRSRAFYHPSVMGAQIKSPVQWVVQLCRCSGRSLPPAVALVGILNEVGQVPFLPPNVKGWDAGAAWITVSSLSARFGHGRTLVAGGGVPVGQNVPGGRGRTFSLDAAPIAGCFAGLHGMPVEVLMDALEDRFLMVPLQEVRRKEIERLMIDAGGGERLVEAAAALVATPEYQLA